MRTLTVANRQTTFPNVVSEKLRSVLIRDTLLFGSCAFEEVVIDNGVNTRRRRAVDITQVVVRPDGEARMIGDDFALNATEDPHE